MLSFKKILPWFGRGLYFVNAALQSVIEGFAGTMTVRGTTGKAVGIVGATASGVVALAMYYAFTREKDIWEIFGEMIDNRRKKENKSNNDDSDKLAHNGYDFFSKNNLILVSAGLVGTGLTVMDSLDVGNSMYQTTISLFDQLQTMPEYHWLTHEMQVVFVVTVAILSGISEGAADISLTIALCSHLKNWLYNIKSDTNTVLPVTIGDSSVSETSSLLANRI